MNSDTINSIYESVLTEDVLSRLASFGVTLTDSDSFAVAFCIQKAEQTVKNDCNVNVVPDGLSCYTVDLACGEFIKAKYAIGQLDIGSLDLDGALASVTEGDTSVSYDNSASDANKLKDLIAALCSSLRGETVCYRKIKW